AFDARPAPPVPRPDHAPAAGTSAAAGPQPTPTCKRHMCTTLAVAPKQGLARVVRDAAARETERQAHLRGLRANATHGRTRIALLAGRGGIRRRLPALPGRGAGLRVGPRRQPDLADGAEPAPPASARPCLPARPAPPAARRSRGRGADSPPAL